MFGEVFHFSGVAEHVPFDYEEVTVDASAVGLDATKVSKCSMVVIRVVGGPLRMTYVDSAISGDMGTVTDPTSTVGYLLYDMDQMTLSRVAASMLRCIKSSVGSTGTLQVIYCIWHRGRPA